MALLPLTRLLERPIVGAHQRIDRRFSFCLILLCVERGSSAEIAFAPDAISSSPPRAARSSFSTIPMVTAYPMPANAPPLRE